MDSLNHYAISRLLGAELKPIKAASFGNFNLLPTAGEALKSLRGATQRGVKLSVEDDRLIVQAFEEVRRGAAPDRILWDSKLAEKFDRRCRSLGLVAQSAVLRRRLLNVRKNSARYTKLGLRISPTTKTEPQPSVLPQFAHAIEFALVRLRYRYGCSIDEILLDPDLGEKFEELALSIAPQLSSSDARLGALYIRKTRHVGKKEKATLGSLDPRQISQDWSDAMSLSAAARASAPEMPGLVEVKDDDRCLYVSRTDDVAPCVQQLASAKAFEALATLFWTPNRDRIALRYIAGEKIRGVSAHRWELRLITMNEPVFNWPIRTAA